MALNLTMPGNSATMGPKWICTARQTCGATVTLSSIPCDHTVVSNGHHTNDHSHVRRA